MPPKTQKAAGVYELVRGGTNMGRFATVPDGVRFLPGDEPGNFPAFARPCPLTPRHGFVESRKVYSVGQLISIFAEAVREDQQAEMMLMPIYSGRYSAVATNAGISFGRGNAGVTGLGEGVVTVPAGAKKDVWNRAVWGHGSRLDKHIKDTTYVEFVENNDRLVAVQLRDGPTQEIGAKDYLPRDVNTVAETRIDAVDYGDDLLRWEKRIASANPAEEFVWLPNGALSSHFAVHAIMHGVPVVTSDLFADTPVLKAGTGTVLAKIEPDNYALLSKLCDYYAEPNNVPSWKKDSFAEALRMAIAMVHASPLWGDNVILLRLRAAGMVALVRGLVAACLGETRHFYDNGPGRGSYHSDQTPAVPWLKLGGNDEASPVGYRNLVYNHTLKINFGNMGYMARCAYKDFRHGWKGSYGGPKWAAAARVTYELFEALQKFMKRPDEAHWTATMLKANVAINTVHNNGRVLTKWVGGDDMTMIANAPTVGFMTPVAAQICLNATALSDVASVEFHDGEGNHVTQEEPPEVVWEAVEPTEKRREEHDEPDEDISDDDEYVHPDPDPSPGSEANPF